MKISYTIEKEHNIQVNNQLISDRPSKFKQPSLASRGSTSISAHRSSLFKSRLPVTWTISKILYQ